MSVSSWNRPSATSSICGTVAVAPHPIPSSQGLKDEQLRAYADEAQLAHGYGHDHARHDHGHDGHDHDHGEHGHSHGLVHDSIKRSREGVRAVLTSLGLLGVAAVAQTVVFVLSGSVALLADLIHNFGDALTAVPLGIAFLLRSELAERGTGLFVVAAIFISACVAGVEAIRRLIHESPPTHLWRLQPAAP
jgi:hypothetical protein